MYFFAGVFIESHPVYDQTQGTGAVFSWLYGCLYYVEKMFDHCVDHWCLSIIFAHFLITSYLGFRKLTLWESFVDYRITNRVSFIDESTWVKIQKWIML